MATETELFYGALLAINGLLAAATIWYQLRRLKIEESKNTTLVQQRDSLHAYYDARLSVEKAKLSVEREKLAARNGEQKPKRTDHILPRPVETSSGWQTSEAGMAHEEEEEYFRLRRQCNDAGHEGPGDYQCRKCGGLSSS